MPSLLPFLRNEKEETKKTIENGSFFRFCCSSSFLPFYFIIKNDKENDSKNDNDHDSKNDGEKMQEHFCL